MSWYRLNFDGIHEPLFLEYTRVRTHETDGSIHSLLFVLDTQYSNNLSTFNPKSGFHLEHRNFSIFIKGGFARGEKSDLPTKSRKGLKIQTSGKTSPAYRLTPTGSAKQDKQPPEAILNDYSQTTTHFLIY